MKSPRSDISLPLLLGALLAGAIVVSGGCSMVPPETAQEKAKLEEAGKPFQLPFERRQLPDLPEHPGWRDLLQRAFLANGNLEAAWFDWKVAVERVNIEGAYPNSNVQLGFSYLFSREKMKAWDRATVSAGFDPSMMLQWPEKVRQAAKVALDEAQATGLRFVTAKFDLQAKVLSAWLDYQLVAEKSRLQTERVQWLTMLADTAAQRLGAGGPRRVLLDAQSQLDMARNEQANLTNEQAMTRATLNGLLARAPEASLPPEAELPRSRPAPQDYLMIHAGVDHHPELAALAAETQGRADALQLAQLQYLPDISPQLSLTGTASQMLGAMITLPSNMAKVAGGVEQARAMLRQSQALARQSRSSHAAQYLALILALRNNERQVQFLTEVALDKARQILADDQHAYENGAMAFSDLVADRLTILDLRALIAEAGIEREKRLVEIEAMAGVDLETVTDEKHD